MRTHRLLSTHRGRVRTPTILQMDAVECGAAALGIILEYYGCVVPLAELRHVCGVSRDGSTAANIVAAARLYGLSAKGFKKSLETVQDLRGPYIVFWNFNHFLVVEGFRKGRVYLNDPETGPRTVTFAEFDHAFTGVVLVLQPGPDFTPGGRRPSLFRALRKRLHGSGSALIYCLLAGLLLVVPGLALPMFTQLFIDHLLIQEQTAWLRPLLIGMLLTACGRGLLMRLQLRQLRRLKLKLATVMSSQFVWHLLHLPTRFYAQRYAGEIATRTALNDKVADTLSGRLAVTAIDVLMMLFYAGLMMQYDTVLTLIGLGFAAVNLIALQCLSRWRIDTNRRWRQELGKLNGVAIAGLQNIETLKASALESTFFARWAGHDAKAMREAQKLEVGHQTLSILPVLLSALTTMLVLVVGGLRVMDGHLSIGMLVALQSLMQSFMTPVTTLVDLGGTLQELRGDVERLDDVLQHPTAPPPNRSRQLVTQDTFRLQGAIEVKHLTFGYSRVGAPLIDDLSFSLAPGQRMALVGASGSGKSTVAKLLAGLYEPWDGDIRFDGTPRQQIPRQILIQSLAMVNQDSLLFAGTVRDNLTLWDATVSTRDLIRACKDADIHETIVTLADGYDRPLLEGAVNLSGGQRQRLEIARALMYDPSILILDEATNALDAATEQTILMHLKQRACTCIMVAHRLSTIRDCDEIIVLEHGKVVQRGTHSALMAQGGVYAQLIQSEGDAW
nr:NHLP family bacteriocin export ABC transporter peptidase/permease/ATPase subunit [Candidatus Entotheonella palauensis]